VSGNSTISIPVDVRNPGQFFACCGLLELAWRAGNDAIGSCGCFGRGTFELQGDASMLIGTLRHLVDAEPIVEENREPLGVLRLPGLQLRLDWWREPGRRKDPWDKTPFKLWAGQQTSASIYSTLRTTVASALTACDVPLNRPFALRAPLTSRFGFDPGAAWNALDAGFSPNDQDYGVSSSPVVELLAAVGIQRFRPIPVNDDQDAFEYVAWSQPLPACVAVAVAAACVPDSSSRRFRFRIASRGSYGCFTTATEITR